MNQIFVFLLFYLLLNGRAYSQPPQPALGTAVTVDLIKRTVSEIPFDMPFYFTGEIPEDSKIERLVFYLKKGRESGGSFTEIGAYTKQGPKWYKIAVTEYLEKGSYLLPDRSYTLKILAYKLLDTTLKTYQELTDFSMEYGFITTSKFGDQIKSAFGLGYAFVPKALFGATTVNLYFTPINDGTDLQKITSVRRNIFLRASAFFGIAPLTLSSDTKQPIINRYGLGNFVFGFAIRSPFYGCYTPFNNKVGQKLLQPMRINFGWLLYKQANANPIVLKEVSKTAFFAGLSYDFSIASLLGPVAKLF